MYAKLLREQNNESLQSIYENLNEKTGEEVAFFSDYKNIIIDNSYLDQSKQNLIVIDDSGNTVPEIKYSGKKFQICLQNQKRIAQLYLSLMILHSIPPVLKRNCNYITLFRFKDKKMLTTYKSEFALVEFQRVHTRTTQHKYNCLLIDKVNI